MEQLPEFALSVRQPWAHAIIYFDKDVENRSWQAVNHGLRVRGRIAIHAAKGLGKVEYEEARKLVNSRGWTCPDASALRRGGIIGSVEVVDVVSEHDSPSFSDRAASFCAIRARARSLPASARWVISAGSRPIPRSFPDLRRGCCRNRPARTHDHGDAADA